MLGEDTKIEGGRLKLHELASHSGKDLAIFDLEAEVTHQESEGSIQADVTGTVIVSVDGARVQSIEVAGPIRATMDELQGLALEGEMTMRSEYRCKED